MSEGVGGTKSTAAVLWLMILLVFLPIAAAHVVARSVTPGSEPAGDAKEHAATNPAG